MKLSEIFTQLSHGELSQMNLGGSGSGVIEDAAYDRLVSCINLGLSALHTRFPIRHGQLTLNFIADKVLYPIHSRYAESRSSSEDKYIMDSASPYLDDLMKVEKVYTLEGQRLSLNDEADDYSVNTPSMTTIMVPIDLVNHISGTPDEYVTAGLVIHYRAAHPYLPAGVGMYRANTVDIELPYQYLEALCYFVASRINNPMGMTNEFHAGNSYATKYEMACMALERDNIRVDQVSQPNRIERNGWV